jgi:hypothetical protein
MRDHATGTSPIASADADADADADDAGAAVALKSVHGFQMSTFRAGVEDLNGSFVGSIAPS